MPNARQCLSRVRALESIVRDVAREAVLPRYLRSSRSRKARKGRNPATGKAITIAAKNYPVFRAGKTLKDRVAK